MRGTYPFLLWIGAAFFLPSPLADADSKPQVKKETHKNFSIENDVQKLDKYTITEYNIYGKIIQLTDYETTQTGKTQVKHNIIHKYDPQGNRIGTLKYNGDGNLIWSEEYVLDILGRKTRVNSAAYAPINQYTYTLYEYDALGNESLVKTFTEKDHQTSEIQRTYSSNNELTVVSQWFYILEEDKLVKKLIRTENEYNDIGQLSRSSTETQIGRNKWREVQLFENGFMVEWLKYENGKLSSQFKHQKRDTVAIEQHYEIPPPIPFQDPFFEYDDAKRDPLEHISHTPVSIVTIKQDQSGNITKKTLREHNEVVEVSYFDYDENNNLIHIKTIDKKTDNVKEIFRNYDHHRNLTKETVLFNEVKVKETYFEYEYYE